MKNYLIQQDAWKQEGIFRLAGEASDIQYVKQQMNKTKRLDVSTNPDINSIANLLKVLFCVGAEFFFESCEGLTVFS